MEDLAIAISSVAILGVCHHLDHLDHLDHLHHHGHLDPREVEPVQV